MDWPGLARLAQGLTAGRTGAMQLTSLACVEPASAWVQRPPQAGRRHWAFLGHLEPLAFAQVPDSPRATLPAWSAEAAELVDARPHRSRPGRAESDSDFYDFDFFPR